jgi:hypothetical protein
MQENARGHEFVPSHEIHTNKMPPIQSDDMHDNRAHAAAAGRSPSSNGQDFLRQCRRDFRMPRYVSVLTLLLSNINNTFRSRRSHWISSRNSTCASGPMHLIRRHPPAAPRRRQQIPRVGHRIVVVASLDGLAEDGLVDVLHESGPLRMSVKDSISMNDDILPAPNIIPARCCRFFRRVRMMSTRQLTIPRGEPPCCFCKLGIPCCVTLLGRSMRYRS